MQENSRQELQGQEPKKSMMDPHYNEGANIIIKN